MNIKELLENKIQVGLDALSKLERIEKKFESLKENETILTKCSTLNNYITFFLVKKKNPETLGVDVEIIGTTDNELKPKSSIDTISDLDHFEEFNPLDWDMDDLLDDSNPTIWGMKRVHFFPYLPGMK